ncbi:segregation/condensation protein A [Haladaptatus caseinilyticus]|uniref:segregation/condensation protein A n=1 Tax=Haladaptatus caseinilyticus TaxID=2993314 RepID=UPI00224B41C0|nr:ScpA family protein [Haladaptatus caseinilyticus]
MTDGDIPLDIAGHDERKRGRASDGREDVDALVPDEHTADDDEDEPVELLVQLAEDGEIEPWDIDIVDVTDKFLARLDEADLRTSGRALFYASVLLRMKSDALLADDEPEEEELDPWEAPMAMDASMDDGGFDPVASLEDEMERRLDRKHARGNPETLDELVRDLRERERGSWWKESRTYDTSDSPQGFRRGTQTLDYHSGDDMRFDDEPTESEVTGTTHDEDIEAVIDDVQSALVTQYEAGRTEVLYAEIEGVGPSRVETYLALLFLAHRSFLTLDQDDLFGDLWVQDARDAEEEQPPELLAD